MIELDELIPVEEVEDEKPDEQPKVQVIVNFPPRKSEPIEVFGGRPMQIACTSDPIDVGQFSNAHIEVRVSGTNPSATVTAKGGSSSGKPIQLPDANAQKTNVSQDTAFDVVVGSNFLFIDLSSVSGTFGSGLGFVVVVTLYNN